MLSKLQKTIDMLVSEFSQIPDHRKIAILELTELIQARKKSGENISLTFICTHNSRRSHIAQIWAQAAAYFYNVPNVQTFSGGTEVTAFNSKAVSAMKNAGFDISLIKDGENPRYEVRFAADAELLPVFSKTYDDPSNPSNNFAAIMTCSHADENCPFVPGAIKRIKLTYDDPKAFDDTPLEAQKYFERVEEIGREMLYAFSLVK